MEEMYIRMFKDIFYFIIGQWYRHEEIKFKSCGLM